MVSDDSLQRSVLPIPDRRPVSLTTYDAKDPDTKYPPITQLRPPTGAPNVLVILLDDVGFGASSAFGGPCQTPTAERPQLFFPGMRRLSENSVINIKNKSHSVMAELEIPDSRANGVIIAHGGNMGGWCLYVQIIRPTRTIATTAIIPGGRLVMIF